MITIYVFETWVFNSNFKRIENLGKFSVGASGRSPLLIIIYKPEEPFSLLLKRFRRELYPPTSQHPRLKPSCHQKAVLHPQLLVLALLNFILITIEKWA